MAGLAGIPSAASVVNNNNNNNNVHHATISVKKTTSNANRDSAAKHLPSSNSKRHGSPAPSSSSNNRTGSPRKGPLAPITEYRVYDDLVAVQYVVPAERVQRTVGSDAYVRHERTPNWKKKLQAEENNTKGPVLFYVCEAYRTTGECPHGSYCREVHVDSLEAVDTVPVHSKTMGVGCGLLGAGVSLPICDRSSGMITPFPSERVLSTKGSEDWVATHNMSTQRRKIYHCRHFFEDGLCLRGPACVFLHALTPEEVENSKNRAEKHAARLAAAMARKKSAQPAAVNHHTSTNLLSAFSPQNPVSAPASTNTSFAFGSDDVGCMLLRNNNTTSNTKMSTGSLMQLREDDDDDDDFDIEGAVAAAVESVPVASSGPVSFGPESVLLSAKPFSVFLDDCDH
eukprot:PhM_4_TR9515/c1_g1_i3/m.98262